MTGNKQLDKELEKKGRNIESEKGRDREEREGRKGGEASSSTVGKVVFCPVCQRVSSGSM